MKSVEVKERTDVLETSSSADWHDGVPQLSCVVIGRAVFADLRIHEHYSEHEVAQQHLKIVLDGGGGLLAICLARSMVVNGKSLSRFDLCPLNKGDVIKLGSRVEIYVDGVPQKEDNLLVLRVMNEARDEGHYAFRLAKEQHLTMNGMKSEVDEIRGPFRILHRRGGDSQNAVYKAVCERGGFVGVPVGKIVALKVLTAQGGEKSWLAKLQSRVEELKKLVHPGIARCFGSFCEPGSFGGMHVLVTEWLEGETLKDRLLRNPQGLDADEVVRIGCQVLSALTYVSTRGIAHRDIKPSNIFLCKDGTVKLIGFEQSCETGRDGGVGWNGGREFPYLAPDFLDPEFSGDEQSDIFSVGVCLHEMLTGRLPYRQQQDGFIFSFMDRWRRGNEDIQMDKRIDRILQGATEVLAKALTWKREERYATFADFAAAFTGVRYRELTYEANTWRLVQYVGRGSFGEVFKARDIKTGQVVAIKRLLERRYADLFRVNRMPIVGLLNDSSIVRHLAFFLKRDSVRGSEQAFLVMEFLDGMPGQSLSDVLERACGTPLQRDVVIRAFVRYAHGLSVVHNRGLVHRNIKPSNLYFPEKAIDRAAIMDLAIVCEVDLNGTVSEMNPCTLDYVPHEIVSGARGDTGMDVFALGLSLYEALSGKKAYPRLPAGEQGLMAFCMRAKNKARPNLDESSYSDLSDLVRLVREMTEPDVAKRLKDAAEVERRLRALLVGQNEGDAATCDDPEPQTLDAAPSFDELGIVDVPSCLPDFDEIRRANEEAVRCARWFSRMRKYFVGVPLLILALSCAVGCVVGAFWLGELFARDAVQRLGDSLFVRAALLFPWLIGIVFAEARLGRMPDVLTGGCLLSGIMISIFADGVSLISSICAVAAGAAVLCPFFLRKAIGSGAVMLFAGTLSFWGIQWLPFALASFLFMFYPVLLARPVWGRWFAKYDEHELPASPVVLLAMLNIGTAIWFSNGRCMIGSYVFMAGVVAVAAVARLLFRERKQHVEVVSPSPSTCAVETAPSCEDARTVTTTGSESHGLLDATCRASDDLVSETDDGTDDPSAFVNFHGQATIHGFRQDPSPLVAEGGQGRVFKAECVEEGRLGLRKGEVVALKFVEETDQSPSFEDFERAMAYLREIKSPHVPRYYGCFRVERRVNGKLKRFRMTVMEYLDGADLGYRVKVRSPNFYADEIMYVLDQLLEGLCELAEAGIVHRDIKPSNIFICRDGTVKLIDFDTALIRGIDLCPKNRKIVGTPEFAAPDYLTEGFRGDEISDVFSVGMTLYYMVHGVSPHRAKGTLSGRMDENTFRAFWVRHQEESGDHVWWKKQWKVNGDWLSGDARPGVPLLGIQKLFERSLLGNRSRRFGSLAEFHEFLSNIEFVRAKHGGEYIRVISDCLSVSGAGIGFSCIFGRDGSGCIKNWGFEGFDIFWFGGDERHVEYEQRILEWILRVGMYELDASPDEHRGVFLGNGHRGRHERFVKVCRSRFESYIKREKFVPCDVAVLRKSFAEIKSLEKWQIEVEEHEFQMQQS